MDADDSADLVVRFASSAVGTLRLSLCLPTVTSELEFFGEDGVMGWDRNLGVWVNGELEMDVPPFDRPFPDLNIMYLAEAAHFLACIRGEATPVCDGWDGLQTLKVVDAARRASEEKRWVTV